jgi:hypothetical protein
MSILALVNHTFQSWRIYRFTDSKILAAFLLVISFANCGIGVTVAIETWIFSTYVPIQKINYSETTLLHSYQALRASRAAAHYRG